MSRNMSPDYQKVPARPHKDFLPSVLTAIITHNGVAEISETLEALRWAASWPCPVFIVDNASTDQTIDLIDKLDYPDLELLSLERNAGVAEALNIALDKARKSSSKWLFILDQDSRCVPGCLDVLFREAELLHESDRRTGAVCPVARSRKFPESIHMPYIWTGTRLMQVESGESEVLEIDSTITSGTMYLVEALENAGGFKQEYFIDFVDHECHLRMRRAGWKIFWISRAGLEHSLGKHQEMTPEGLWIEHEPWRYYFMTRNMIHGYYSFGGCRAVSAFLGDALRHSRMLRRYGRSSNKCIRHMLKGILHGFLGKLGPLAPRN